MRWATRSGPHVDRAASAWLIRRFVDPEATFVFVADAADIPHDATPFDVRGADWSHHDGDCTFETIVRRRGLRDPALRRIARIVHEADLGDERFDAPEAAGLDAVLRGFGATLDDDQLLDAAAVVFDGLYALFQRTARRSERVAG